MATDKVRVRLTARRLIISVELDRDGRLPRVPRRSIRNDIRRSLLQAEIRAKAYNLEHPPRPQPMRPGHTR